MGPEFYMELVASTNSLEHHGVEGMKWGKRNGPPYPLDAAGREKLKRQRTTYTNEAQLYDMYAEESLKAALPMGITTGLIVAGVAAVSGAGIMASPIGALGGASMTLVSLGDHALSKMFANKYHEKAQNIQNILDQDTLEKNNKLTARKSDSEYKKNIESLYQTYDKKEIQKIIKDNRKQGNIIDEGDAAEIIDYRRTK